MNVDLERGPTVQTGETEEPSALDPGSRSHAKRELNASDSTVVDQNITEKETDLRREETRNVPVETGLDTLLIMGSLFLAAEAPFVIESLKQVQPDHQERSAAFLKALVLINLGNSTDVPALLEPPTVQKMNADANYMLIYAFSYTLDIVAGAALAKQWIRCNRRRLQRNSPWSSHQGKFATFIDISLELLHVGLLLVSIAFFIGLSMHISYQEWPVAGNIYLSIAIVSFATFLFDGFYWVRDGIRWLIARLACLRRSSNMLCR